MNIHEGKGYGILANKGPDQHIFLYRADQGTSLPIYGTPTVGSSALCEPRCEKTCLLGSRQSTPQTSLLNYRD